MARLYCCRSIEWIERLSTGLSWLLLTVLDFIGNIARLNSRGCEKCIGLWLGIVVLINGNFKLYKRCESDLLFTNS